MPVIDCMTSVDIPEDGMSAVTVKPGQLLVLQIGDPFEFRARCPGQCDALVECTAFVNYRRKETGDAKVIALLFSGPTHGDR
jgi:hypothetical protein